MNTTSWSASPAAIAWADVVAAETALITDKALRGNLAYLCDPATFAALKTTTKVSSDAGAPAVAGLLKTGALHWGLLFREIYGGEGMAIVSAG